MLARAKVLTSLNCEKVVGIIQSCGRDVLKSARLVDLVAGASTPEEHINAMQLYLETIGPQD